MFAANIEDTFNDFLQSDMFLEDIVVSVRQNEFYHVLYLLHYHIASFETWLFFSFSILASLHLDRTIVVRKSVSLDRNHCQHHSRQTLRKVYSDGIRLTFVPTSMFSIGEGLFCCFFFMWQNILFIFSFTWNPLYCIIEKKKLSRVRKDWSIDQCGAQWLLHELEDRILSKWLKQLLIMSSSRIENLMKQFAEND